MLAQEPHSIHRYGREWRVGAERFPVSQTITGVILDLEPGGLRELHWHPNADEWQYVIEGQYRVSLFGSHGRYRTEALDKGDVAYIPQGYGHSIENVGTKPGRLLIGFNSGYYQAIDATQWLAGVPPYLLADHFSKPKELFEQFPRQRAFISPPDGSGQREIK
jgi:oxalate decarboxylase